MLLPGLIRKPFAGDPGATVAGDKGRERRQTAVPGAKGPARSRSAIAFPDAAALDLDRCPDAT
jgi:hypothetical protein